MTTSQAPTGTAASAAPARVTARVVAEAADRLSAPSPVVAGVLSLLDEGSAPVRLIAARDRAEARPGAAARQLGAVQRAGRHPRAAAAACGLARDALETLLMSPPETEGARRRPGLTDRGIQVRRMLERGSAAKQVAHELGLLGVDASRGRRAGCDLHTGAVTADTGADADRALSAARQAGRNRVCAAAATA